MPSYPCAWPTCAGVYVAKRGAYCEAHRAQGAAVRRERDRRYNRTRNPQTTKFYHSAAWLRTRRTKLACTPWCERCRRVFAAHVHHVIPLERCTDEQKLAQENLRAVCRPCHNVEDRGGQATVREGKDRGGGLSPQKTGVTLRERAPPSPRICDQI